MRESAFFIASLAGAAVLTALAILLPPESPFWRWTLWGGVGVFLACACVIAINTVRPESDWRLLAGMGLGIALFISCAIPLFFNQSSRSAIVEKAEPINSLVRKLIVNCESYVPRPTKFREDKKLYMTQIINPRLGNQQSIVFSVANTSFPAGTGDIKWDDTDTPISFGRCEIINYSAENLFRVSFDMPVYWQKVIKTENGTTNGDIIATTTVKSPEFDLAAQVAKSDFFYLYNRSDYYVFIEKPLTASIYTSDSDKPKIVKLIPSSSPLPGILFQPFARRKG